MTTSLEQIIRPFQGKSVSPPQQYFPAGQVGVPPVILRFGRVGQGRVLNGSINYSQTFYMTQYINEKKTASWGTPT